jgi:hypothetical protein
LSVPFHSIAGMTKPHRNRPDQAPIDDPPDEDEDDRKRQGDVYDIAVRGVIEGAPAAACRFLGIPAQQVHVMPSVFLVRKLGADLLLRVGPRHLVHIEYMDRISHDRSKTDLVTRMLGYRYVIMRDYPDDELSQHILVLGGGRIRGHDQLQRRGFALDLQITYLPKVEPERLLAEPGLAPLASLARGTRAQRAEAFAQAIAICRAGGGELAADLIEFSTTLATKNLNPNTIKTILKEATVPVKSMAEVVDIVRDTPIGETLQEEGRAQGRAEGRDQGRAEGREAERENLLIALLKDRFGELPELQAAAHRLAGWPDPVRAFHAITAARTITDL